MTNINREIIGDDITFTTISDQKFKTTKLSISFIVPLDAETAAGYSILSGLIPRSSEDYPDFTILSKKLAMLYGASLSGNNRRIGDNSLITFSISAIDDKYALNSEVVSEKISKLLCDLIFRPKLNGNSFCEKEINQEKRLLKEAIDAEFNDKRAYSLGRFKQIMFQDEPYGYKLTKEDVDAVSGEELYTLWQTLLKKGKVQIFFIGESSSKHAVDIFRERFSQFEREPYEISNIVKPHCGEVKREREQMELAQSKMILGFRTPIAVGSSEVMPLRVAIALLGATAHSKLFTNVREKLSLCYYCTSRYTRLKGAVEIESGVEKENIDKAEKAILNEIQQMKDGNITDFELKATQLSMCNNIIAVCDNQSGLENWYLGQILDDNILSIDEMCEAVCSVTKEQMIDAVKTIEFDTMYVLESK